MVARFCIGQAVQVVVEGTQKAVCLNPRCQAEFTVSIQQVDLANFF